MMKQTRKMLLLLALLIPAGAMAQDNEQAIQMSRPAKVQRMTYEQMTEKMVSELKLDDDCTWTLTADTYITSFKGEASHIKTNGHRLFVDGKEMKISQ